MSESVSKCHCEGSLAFLATSKRSPGGTDILIRAENMGDTRGRMPQRWQSIQLQALGQVRIHFMGGSLDEVLAATWAPLDTTIRALDINTNEHRSCQDPYGELC